MVEVLSVVVLIGSGITLGVFFAVAVSVVPALGQLQPAPYIELHQMLGRGYHPAMPIVTNVSTLAGLALAIVVDDLPARLLFIGGVVLLVGVQAVSHLGNVPINRSLRDFDLDAAPSAWQDPRPRWRSFHLLRTSLAAALLLVNSIAVVSLP